jgi:hypothetical protein
MCARPERGNIAAMIQVRELTDKVRHDAFGAHPAAAD